MVYVLFRIFILPFANRNFPVLEIQNLLALDLCTKILIIDHKAHFTNEKRLMHYCELLKELEPHIRRFCFFPMQNVLNEEIKPKMHYAFVIIPS